MKERNILSGSLSSSEDELESGIAGRLKVLIGDQSVSGFARKAGVSESLLRQYVSGSMPGADKLVLLARAGGVTIEWLATGEGPMKAEEGAPAPLPAKINVDLLRSCIGAVESYIKLKGAEPSLEIKAGLTAALYRYAEARGMAEPEDMKEFLKLVA